MKFVNVLLEQKDCDALLEMFNLSIFPSVAIQTSETELAYRPHSTSLTRLSITPFFVKAHTSIPFKYGDNIFLWKVVAKYEKWKHESIETAMAKCKDMLYKDVRHIFLHGKIEDINLINAIGMRVYESLHKYVAGAKYEEIDNIELLLENL